MHSLCPQKNFPLADKPGVQTNVYRAGLSCFVLGNVLGFCGTRVLLPDAADEFIIASLLTSENGQPIPDQSRSKTDSDSE